MTEDRVVLRPELCATFKVKSETVGKWIRLGKLPKPDTKITQRTSGWRLSTLEKAGVVIGPAASPRSPGEAAA